MPASREPSRPERSKILVTVKTYPLLSFTYTETVCTAGLREGGQWIRIYPIPYRFLEKTQRFKKYQWIEAKIVRDTRDPRPESYKLVGKIKPLTYLDTSEAWEQRKKLVLGKVYHRLDTLIQEARDTCVSTSLAVFKPKRIINFTIERESPRKNYAKKRRTLMRQLSREDADRLVRVVPYRFYYTFVDQLGKRSTLQILDWEIYQLCRKMVRKYGHRQKKLQSLLRAKYLDQLTQTRDVYFFLGTNKYWHIRRSNNPFMIMGIFYPPAILTK